MNSKKKLKHIKKTHIIQRYHSDCGVACLLSIIQYYGGSESLEQLREQSGTTLHTASLLGLYQAAKQKGFDVKGTKGDIQTLKKHNIPVILHFLYDGGLGHYVVCYEYNNQAGFLIGDPAKGIYYLSEKEIEQYWCTRNYLVLLPNEKFITNKLSKKNKRELLFQLLNPDLKLLLFIIIIGLGVALFGLSVSVFSQKLIDDILPTQNTQKLIIGIVLLSILLLFRVGFIVLREFLIIKQSQNFNNRINNHFFDNLLHLPKLFFDNRKIGELVARLNDTNRIQDIIKTIISSTIMETLICIVSIMLLWFYSPTVVLICVAGLPIYFLVIFRNNKKITDSQRAIMQSHALNESNYITTIQGISTVKNDNKQNAFLKQNISIFGNFQHKIFRLGMINIQMSWQAGIIGVVFLIGILSYTSIAVLNNELKLGELMAILGISGSLLPSIGNLALTFISINEAKVAFDRMYDIVSVEKEQEEGMNLNEINSIEVQDVSFRFAGRQPLFEHLNLTLKKGTVTAIIGESGGGKTTLANILQKFYSWEQGKIIVNKNIALQNIAIENWRSKIGVIPQEVYIFNGNLLYNISLSENANAELIQQLIEQYELTDIIKSLPNGLMTIIGEEGINLSGGQKQIIGLLRVLYRSPQFYILDEPTAALDKNTETLVVKILERLKQNSIILIITHRLSLINKVADFVYELNKGTMNLTKQII
ncbi:MAG: peptidase domain-containing ABC transporter [Prevotellaceae bacterium]|jgi:ATP-binding cassette subfamily B protein|nr:peptidase domain-containing ABC transporter [Prevotellaceae bacterium]